MKDIKVELPSYVYVLMLMMGQNPHLDANNVESKPGYVSVQSDFLLKVMKNKIDCTCHHYHQCEFKKGLADFLLKELRQRLVEVGFDLSLLDQPKN